MKKLLTALVAVASALAFWRWRRNWTPPVYRTGEAPWTDIPKS